VVLEDGVRLTEVASEIAVNSSGEWYSDGAYLYIQCSDDAAPSTHTIEAGRRDTAIAINAKSYITLDGITTSGGNTYGGMFIWTNSAASSNVTVQNCTIRNATGHGINVTNAHETHKTTDILINGNTVHGNGSTGINVGDGVNTLTISKNTVYANNVDLANYNAGIRVNPVDGVDGTDTVIEYNKVYGNLLVGNSKWQQGNGIHIDYTASGAVVRYNEVYDNESVGIFIEASDTAEVYGNLSYGNTDEGVLVYRYEGGCLVYNNSSYGNGTGIGIRGEDADDRGMVGHKVKNNIIFNNTSAELAATFGGENDGTMGSGNVYLNNCLGAESSNFIEWGDGVDKSTYDDWETAYGGTTTSVESDPLFTNPSSDDFTLQSTSPAKEAAVPITGYNIRLHPDSSWPDGVRVMPNDEATGAYGRIARNPPPVSGELRLFEREVLAASGNADSVAVNVGKILSNYDFSVEYFVDGSGSIKIEYLLCSTEDGTYINTGTDIGTTLTGHDILSFSSGEPELAPFMKIRITEDGGANAVAVTLYLNIQ